MRSQTVDTYLTQLAGRVPTPGGGATAALHAAQAAALIAMVGRYSNTARYAAHADRITDIVAAADQRREDALRLADADIAAFSAVGTAYQLPKEPGDQAAIRAAAIAAALVAAGRVPAEVIRVADRIVALAEELEPIGNPNVISDVAAAADAARAAASTARVNVEINLSGITDRNSIDQSGIDQSIIEELVAAIADVDGLALRADKVTAAVRHRLAR
ncbi:cyclodeaminase/cyclohydrolase family protein [Nakamurella sp. GG22]